jgi:hypothetical protein
MSAARCRCAHRQALMDSILCGEGSTANCAKYLSEVSRVLKPNGVLLVVSYGSPDHRRNHLDRDYGWSVEVVTVPKPAVGAVKPAEEDGGGVHYVYVCRKGRGKKK